MALKQYLTNLKLMLANSEMFARPSKQIIGSWYLVEYYIDEENELVHIKTDGLKKHNQFWEITFSEENNLSHQLNLNIPVLQTIENGEWSTHKNFICFHHPNDFRKTVEFQFAIDKGILKILKKNIKGEIDFFGFFERKTKCE